MWYQWLHDHPRASFSRSYAHGQVSASARDDSPRTLSPAEYYRCSSTRGPRAVLVNQLESRKRICSQPTTGRPPRSTPGPPLATFSDTIKLVRRARLWRGCVPHNLILATEPGQHGNTTVKRAPGRGQAGPMLCTLPLYVAPRSIRTTVRVHR